MENRLAESPQLDGCLQLTGTQPDYPLLSMLINMQRQRFANLTRLLPTNIGSHLIARTIENLDQALPVRLYDQKELTLNYQHY